MCDVCIVKLNGFCWNFDLFFLFIGFLDHLQMEVVQKPLFPLCYHRSSAVQIIHTRHTRNGPLCSQRPNALHRI